MLYLLSMPENRDILLQQQIWRFQRVINFATRVEISSYLIIFKHYLKITEKVSFNIASEASYVYILSGQKLIQNAKNGQFWRVFENLKLAVKQCYQTGQF